VEILAPKRDIYEKIFAANCKRLGMNQCPGASTSATNVTNERGPRPRASDPRDLSETAHSTCRLRRLPAQLTRKLMAEAAASFIQTFN
jgi:hypothetical protein